MSATPESIPSTVPPNSAFRFKRREFIILCAIICTGMIGCFFCLGNKSTQTVYTSHSMTNVQSNVQVHNDVLKIAGETYVGNKLQFHLNTDYLQQPLYINYGDGEIKRLYTEASFEYHYSLPGNYKLELFTVEKNQKKILSEQSLEISSNFRQLSILK